MTNTTPVQVNTQQNKPLVPLSATKERAKATAAARAIKQTHKLRQRLAIELSIDVLRRNFDSMYSVMMSETAKRHDDGILDSLNLIELGLDELCRVRERQHTTLDDCMGDLTRIGAVCNAINRACGQEDGSIGLYARKSATYVDVLMSVIEVAEDDQEVTA